VHLHRHVGRRENNATASLLSPLIKTWVTFNSAYIWQSSVARVWGVLNNHGAGMA
jgi:hypothetical protein